MDSSRALIALGLGFAVTLLLQGLLIFLARRYDLLAPPSDRGFHAVPTPAIGGLGFALPIFIYLGWWSQSMPALWGLMAGAGALVLIGLVDDLRETGRGLRILVQALALALTYWALDPQWPWWAIPAVGLLLVWHINLTNFMDGIDGLVAVHSLFFCLAVQLLTGGLPGLEGVLVWLGAGALLGFLVFNWPPARLFMGDTGSLFLGLMVAVLAVRLVVYHGLPFFACTVLLTVFWFDASYTLCVRIATRQAFTEPHRTHLYQKLAARFGVLWTIIGFAVLFVLWLTPLAFAATKLAASPLYGFAAQLLAVLPLALAAWSWRAGQPEPHREGQMPCAF